MRCLRLLGAGAIAVAAALALQPAQAQALCGERVGVVFGDTLSAIAARCGVNVETLRQANPGLRGDRIVTGTYLAVPAARQATRGQSGGRLIELAPPAGIAPGASGMSTVIKPSRPLPERPLPLPPPLLEPGQPNLHGFPQPPWP
jgi:Tfp pilus assembly protein FimV